MTKYKVAPPDNILDTLVKKLLGWDTVKEYQLFRLEELDFKSYRESKVNEYLRQFFSVKEHPNLSSKYDDTISDKDIFNIMRCIARTKKYGISCYRNAECDSRYAFFKLPEPVLEKVLGKDPLENKNE